MIVACIPAYNEERTIARIVLKAQKHVDRVIVCDDGSSDMTAQIAESLGATVVRHPENMGKGATLRSLFDVSLKAGAKVMVTLDGDGQHDPDEIPAVIRPVLEGAAEISIGTRFSGENHIPFHRKVGDKFLDFLTNMGAPRKVQDTQSGFRAYSRRAIKEIEIRENGMGADSGILLDARKKKLSISTSPISVSYGAGTSTHNPVRHFADVILSMVRYATQERPLLTLGLPGLVALGIGLGYGAFLLSIYVNTRVFVFAYALLAVGSTLMGAFSLLVALVLYAISNAVKKMKTANEPESR